MSERSLLRVLADLYRGLTAGSDPAPRPTRPARAALDFGELEDRILMSAAPLAAEQPANTTTSGTQAAPAVATAPDGSHVVAWASDGQDGSGWGVYARVFNADGTARTGEILVNQTTDGDQLHPAVAVDGDGHFVVTWDGNGTGDTSGVFARRFDAWGNSYTNEVRVNTSTGGTQSNPAIARDLAGDFVIAWEDNGSAIHAQRYGVGGAVQGTEFSVSGTGSDIHSPAVAMDTAGNFVVAWSENGDICAQSFTSSGSGLGRFLVSQTTHNTEDHPAVAMVSLDHFVVAWGTDTHGVNGWGIYARLYETDGASHEFHVNTTIAGDQVHPAVGMASSGEFLVTWASTVGDGSGSGVFGQAYRETGAADGSQFRINQTTAGDQQEPALAVDPLGHVHVAWEGATAGDTYGIALRTYGFDRAPTLDLDANNSSGLSGADYGATFTEGSAGVHIADLDAAFSEHHAATLQSLTARITNLQDGIAEALAADTSGTAISASYDAASGRLTLSGSDSVGHYEQVLRTITYHNSSQNPTAGERQIEVTGTDLFGASNTATAHIEVVPVNDAPVVNLGSHPDTTFTEGDSPLHITDAGATLTDADSSHLAWLRVTLTNPLDGTHEALLASTAGTAIVGSYDSATGVILLSGNDTVAHYQQVLRSIQYQNDSTDPNPTQRVVTFQASDGSETSSLATAHVNVVPTNEAPVVDLGNHPDTTFTEGDSPLHITDAGATLADADSSHLAWLRVTLTNPLDGPHEALLASTAGTAIVGSYDSATGVLLLSGNDTVAHYQQVLRSIQYHNDSTDPNPTQRVVTFQASDGSEASSLATAHVNVVPTNEAPVVDLGNHPDTTFTEGGSPLHITDAGATLADADSSHLAWLRVTLTNPLDGPHEALLASTAGTAIVGSYDSATGVLLLSGNDTVAHYQQVLRSIQYHNDSVNPNPTERVISFQASDGSEASSLATARVAVVPVNEAPGLDPGDVQATFIENGNPLQVTAADAMLTDADSTYLAWLRVTLTNPLDGNHESLAADTAGTSISASYDSASGVLLLSGSDTVEHYQQVLRSVQYHNNSENPNTAERVISFQASDGIDLSSTNSTYLAVQAVNDAPLAAGQAYDVRAFQELEVSTPGVLVGDSDVDGDQLRAVLVSGPTHGWLQLNANGSFDYIPNPAYYGPDSFQYAASDGTAWSNVATVNINITDMPPPPPGTTTTTTTTDTSHQTNDTSTQEEDAKTAYVGLPGQQANVESAETHRASASTAEAEHPSNAWNSRTTGGRAESALGGWTEEDFAALGPSRGLALWRDWSRLFDTRLAWNSASDSADEHVLPVASAAVTDNDLLLRQLDALGDQFDVGGRQTAVELAKVAGLSAAVSVGYAMWTMRGSYLVASLLASTPAWKMIDPIPILDFSDAQRRQTQAKEDETADSVEELFTRVSVLRG
jgi:lipopolysaccharide export system protein LptA